MDSREERLARNEVLFREVNEQVRLVAERHGVDEHLYEFFCECSNRDCALQLMLTLSQYKGVREHSTWFVVAPGHHLPEIEHVVECSNGFEIVEKEGEAAELADRLDPLG